MNELTKEIEKTETAASLAWWNLATTGNPKFAQEMEQFNIQLRKLYSSPEDYQDLLKQPKSRENFLLTNKFREFLIPQDKIEQMTILETEIEKVYTNFRPIVRGQSLSNNDLKKILADSLDSKERKEAWEASKLIGEQVEEKVLQLIALRNECAKLAGFSDYYSMRLELQELDQDRLFSLLEELNQQTNSQWNHYKNELDRSLSERFKTTQLGPWHYQDPFFQEAPNQGLDIDKHYQGKDLVKIASDFYSSIGLPVDDLLKNADLYERDGKNQHAFCNCLDHKQDIRILCNLRDNEYWMGVLLHELGHGVYDKYIDQNLPYLLRTPSHICTTEASAMLFGRLSKNSSFLKKFCNVEIDDSLLKKQTSANLLVFARWVLVMTHFEKAMYQQPGMDLNSYWWECVERFQGIKFKRDNPDWASKLHLACAPVYYQNYILGEMIASQLWHQIKEFFPSQKVGEYLKTFYSQGATSPWEETVKNATGEFLNPRYFSLDI